jgi:excisionase family DNA binding protein
MTPNKPAYSIPEVLRLVPVGRSTIYREIKARRLKVSKVGRRTIIRADDLEAWLKRL